MKRKILLELGVLFIGFVAVADISISPMSIDYAVGGGGAAIKTSGSGSWTATTDVDWINLINTTGVAGVSCNYVVSRNSCADVREGHITISGNTYTVTQKGCPISLTPLNIVAGKTGASGKITASVDAGVTWTAAPSDSWISISPTSGSGATELSYVISEYNVVGVRTGTIQIGSEKLTVTQTGIEVMISPASTNVTKDVCVVPLQVVALSETKWTVTPNASWISVLDSGNGYGGSQVTLVVAENPSFDKRVGTVTIGTSLFTVTQSGTDDVNFKILPEVATASPKGAFANVAVYATPDASWTAESMDNWIKITDGENGKGNGNVKYVTMSNPELEPRRGHIKFTPPVHTPELDLYSGLLFWIKEQQNIEGNENRGSTYPLSKQFDGSFMNQLGGADIPSLDGREYALSFSFKVGALNCINRILKLGTNRCLYFNEKNVLCYSHRKSEGGWTENETMIELPECNEWYTIVLNQKSCGELDIYCGHSGAELTQSTHRTDSANNVFGDRPIAMSAFKFGFSDAPSTGYLQSGEVGNIRFWSRALTTVECSKIDIKQEEMLDINPAWMPANCKYFYLPLNGNLFYDSSSANGPQVGIANQHEMCASEGKNKIEYNALTFGTNGQIVVPEFNKLFPGSVKRQDGYMYRMNDYEYYLYPYEPNCNEDATINFWVKMDSLPNYGEEHNLLSRDMCPLPCDGNNRTYSAGRYMTDERYGSVTNNYSFSVSINENGDLRVKQYTGKVNYFLGEDYDFTDVVSRWSSSGYYNVVRDLLVRNDLIPLNGNLSIGDWHMLTLVCKARKNVVIYIDGKEIGSCLTSMDFGFMPPVSIGANYYNTNSYYIELAKEHSFKLSIGSIEGSVDEITFLDRALSSPDVSSMYQANLPFQYVYHTVNQGIQEPSISPDRIEVSKFGGTTNITLSVARTINWNAKSDVDWVSIVGDASGTGPATVMVKVDANRTCLPRTGTVTIGTKTLTVHQAALECSVSANKTIFPTEADETGGMGIVSVSPEGNGFWTAESDVNWIYCYPESGIGSYDVYFFVEDMGSTAACRSGTITIGGKTIEITQRGYELSIDPKIGEVGGNAGAGVIGVAADEGAVWTAIADVPWISVVKTTDGFVHYTFTDNMTGETRIGHINISGATYTLTQTCKLELNTTVEGKGLISGGGKYAQGAKVSIVATPASGYEFSHWSGDVVGVDAEALVIMDSAKKVTATFIPEAAAQVLAEKKAAQGGFYTREQIHNLELGNLVLDIDSTTGKARIGVQLQETSDLSNPDWKTVDVSADDLDIGTDGTVGIKASATGNAKFFRVVTSEK